MKRIITGMVIVAMLSLTGCGGPRTINGVTYDTYGLINKDEKKNPDIQYELIIGNMIWGGLLVETIIAPIYFFGFSLWEPVGVKTNVIGEIPKENK